MLKKPRLKQFLTIFPISETTWGLRGGSDELWRLKLRDEEAAKALTLLSYLTGKYAVEEITDLMAAKGISGDEVSSLLQQLQDASLIEESDPYGLSEQERETFRSQLTFFSRFTSDGGAKYQARLRDSRVGIVGDGYLAKTLHRQLKESGFGEILKFDRDAIWALREQQTLPALFFVVQEAEDPQVLDAMNTLSKQRKIPWLLVRAVEANVGWVGPLFIPDETACYESLEARLRSNLSYFPEYQAFSHYLREKRQAAADCGALHVFLELLGAVAVVEAIKFLGNVTVPQLAGRFLTINLTTWDVEAHDVLRVPSLGLEVTEPKLFAWKEMPAESIINEEGSIYSRRS